MIKGLHRPVWAEINLDNLAHNMREVKRIVPEGVRVAGVIKGDGYGHGAVEIGATLLENGADMFAVATTTEAIQLRKYYPEVDILILGYTPNDGLNDVVSNNLIPTIYSYDQAKVLNDLASSMKQQQKYHIKIDTGLCRIGFTPSDESVKEIEMIKALDFITLEGIFTHYATSDEKDKTFTFEQINRFEWMLEKLEQKGIEIPVKHASNSAAVIDLPEKSYSMVRPGIMLYGFFPSAEVNQSKVLLKEVMTLKAEVAHVKSVPIGTGVGYGLTYETKDDIEIATIPLGYADGFTRRFSNNAKVVVKGKITSIVGRVCMDQCMIDVTGLDIKQGDIVTMFGPSPNGVSLKQLYNDADFIPHEIISTIHKRVPRVYTQNGKCVRLKDQLLASE